MLETPRLIIKELQLIDVARFHEYRNKPIVYKYQSWNGYSLFQARRRIKQCLKRPLSNQIGNYQLGIYLKENGLLIGDIYIQVSGPTSFSIGYTIDNDYWSNGYASEMLPATLNYMKEKYGFKYCLANAYQDNYRSIKLLEKNGFNKISFSRVYDDVTYRKYL